MIPVFGREVECIRCELDTNTYLEGIKVSAE
jgi:hypothetical protein